MPQKFMPHLTREPVCIHDVIALAAARWPEHPALVETAGTWNYRELAAALADTRKLLAESDVRPGDRVMIVCENSRPLAALLFATTSLDAWPVLVNARLSAREVDEIREHCRARLVIYTIAASTHAAGHAERHKARTIAIEGSIAISPLNVSAIAEAVEGDPAERVAALIYTSGTTGAPKGVMLTHRNLLFMAAGSVAVRKVTNDDRVYGILPMSHAVGLSVVLLGSLLAGATLYVSSSFDPMSARVLLEKERLTLLFGTPAIFNQWLQYAKLRKISSLKFPALRIITSSGAPLDQATKTATESLFGMPLHNGYGITECSPTIALTRPEAPRSDLSVGPIFPGVEVRLLGGDRETVSPGEVGELQVRGPNIMKGYYRAPEETAAAIDSDGWFNTNDLARLEDGNLFIVGRTKDLIVHHGFNVYPAEVEAVLNGHPGVSRSAVVGRAVGGDEDVVAFVQLAPEAHLTPAQLAEYAAEFLAPYKRPSLILLIPTMPMTPSGKIAKAELKKIAEDKIPGQAANLAARR
jgi:acyl-CoA synthetase (AMP-forming)/AMP-acid ligase II